MVTTSVHLVSETKSQHAITYHDITAARHRIQPHIHTTPILTCRTINHLLGEDVEIYFKAEIFQRIGAFKIRGAINAMKQLNEKLEGVRLSGNRPIAVTHSSGNHAQAVALAAKELGWDAHIIMPNNSSSVKLDAVKGYGATIHLSKPTQEARESLADEVMTKYRTECGEHLVHFIHPYNQPEIMAGQGTCAEEMIEQLRAEYHTTLDAFICPVGGGGLLSGTCIAFKHSSPNTKIYGSEPSAADDCARSIKSGQHETNPHPPQTICDGLLTNTGSLTYPIIRDHVTDILTVDDSEVIIAMKLVMSRMKLVIEPSTAVGVAVLLSQHFRDEVLPVLRKQVQQQRGKDAKVQIGVILEGGNVDLSKLPF